MSPNIPLKNFDLELDMPLISVCMHTGPGGPQQQWMRTAMCSSRVPRAVARISRPRSARTNQRTNESAIKGVSTYMAPSRSNDRSIDDFFSFFFNNHRRSNRSSFGGSRRTVIFDRYIDDTTCRVHQCTHIWLHSLICLLNFVYFD